MTTKNKKPLFDEKLFDTIIVDYDFEMQIAHPEWRVKDARKRVTTFITNSIRKAQREAVMEVLDELTPNYVGNLRRGDVVVLDFIKEIDRIRAKYQEGKE